MASKSALVLWALLAAAPATAGPASVRVLLFAPRATAQERDLADAVTERLRRSSSLGLVPESRFRRLAEAAPRPAVELRREIRAALQRAEAAYRRLAVAEAARTLQELEIARAGVLACPENIELAAQVSLWLGVMHAANAEPARAVERFAATLFIDPQRAIDAAYFPPQTVALFERSRAAIGALPIGGLSISTEPPGAEVFLDGRPVGPAPATVSAAAGDHFVCVRRLGSRDWAARLRVTAGTVETKSIFLQPAGAPELAEALSREASVDLANAAHVEAVAAAVGADVLVLLGPGASLSFRRVGAGQAAHRLAPAEPAAASDRVAADLVSQLERRLSAQPAAAASGPTARAGGNAFHVEVRVAGGVEPAAGLGLFRGAVGLELPVFGPLGLAVAAGVDYAPLHFKYGPNLSGTFLPVGAAVAGYQVPLSFELRYAPWRSEGWEVLAGVGVEVAFVSLDRLDMPPQIPNGIRFSSPGLAPGLAITVGPSVLLGVGLALSDRVHARVGVHYAAAVPVKQPDGGCMVTPPDGSSSQATAVMPTGDTLHQVQGLAAVVFGF